MKYLLSLLLLIPMVSFSQSENGEMVIMDVPAVSPEFPGGSDSLFAFIAKNFKYPEDAKKNREQGTIWVSFVVMADGSLIEINVIRGVSKTLDAETIRVISIMPKWKPGEQAGKKVNVRYTIPIKAKLETTQN